MYHCCVQIVSITNEVGYSSSLVDTSTFLYQVVEFWNNLDWSSPEETYTFMMELINVRTSAVFYLCGVSMLSKWSLHLALYMDISI